MLLSTLLVVATAAAPVKLAAMEFSRTGLDADKARYFAEHFATRLAEDPRLAVVTPKDIATALGMERQRQLLGCANENNSCIAELAGALGVDGIVTGQVAKVGRKYQVSVKVLSSSGSRTLYANASKLLGSEDLVVESLDAAAKEAIERVVAQLYTPDAPVVAAPSPRVEPKPSMVEPTPVVVADTSSPSRPVYRLIPAFVGLAAVAVGGVQLAFAQRNYTLLTTESGWATLEPAVAQAAVREGKTNLGLGLSLAAAGTAAVIGGLLWYFLGSP